MECYGCTEASCNRDFEKIECTSNQNFCATGYFKGSFDRFSVMLLDRVQNTSATPYPGMLSEAHCCILFSMTALHRFGRDQV
ncbi:hypothetical protein chiPu_0023315 [Chiloscyllium punctatum]|uniref:UPAR/Ly6 domain-containing protein n=1 Tax=Chiloscyllium punctatum TaxID=137246 RepID=A0A401T841_CHIPU|nr:hypothetical protein [Chiloscyllium punctatum]